MEVSSTFDLFFLWKRRDRFYYDDDGGTETNSPGGKRVLDPLRCRMHVEKVPAILERGVTGGYTLGGANNPGPTPRPPKQTSRSVQKTTKSLNSSLETSKKKWGSDEGRTV